MKVILSVARQSATGPAIEKYEVSPMPRASVLDCLQLISLTIDPTLTFRENCFASVCGDCGMRINGVERLGCMARIEELRAGDEQTVEVLVEPLRHHKVIRDLVVDRADHFSKLVNSGAVFEEGSHPEFVSNESMEQVLKTACCIHCGLCVSACESYPQRDDFVGPAALAWTARFLQDPRDGATAARRMMAESSAGTIACVECGQCNQVCPEKVAPFDAIRWLQCAASH